MMRSLLIARREAYTYLRSPLGASVIAAALLGVGIYFYWFGLSQRKESALVLHEFFYAASGATMLVAWVLSMRLVAEERQTGTAVLLNTSPVRDRDIVLGKFLSALSVIALMIVLTAYMPALIFVNGKVSLGHIAVGYFGLVLLGAAATAIGLFASCLARTQVVAGIIGGVILVPLILLWMVARAAEPPINEYLAGLAIHHENFKPFMDGTLELRAVVYYLVVTFFFLLAATKVLEARRWR